MVPSRQKNLLVDSHVHDIFSNLPQLLQLHRIFELELATCVSKTPQCIGQAFMKFTPFFAAYKIYITGFERASNFLAEILLKNTKFARFCEDVRCSPVSRGLDLSSLLILPIQRIPRYELLLNEALKLTNENHPDYSNLVQAAKIIKAMAVSINLDVKQYEQKKALLRIAKEIEGSSTNIFDQGRQLLYQGPLQFQVGSYNGKNAHDLPMFFLFNDLLLHCTRRKRVHTSLK